MTATFRATTVSLSQPWARGVGTLGADRKREVALALVAGAARRRARA